MSEYTEKISELDKRLAILAMQLKEARQWCQDTLKELKAIAKARE